MNAWQVVCKCGRWHFEGYRGADPCSHTAASSCEASPSLLCTFQPGLLPTPCCAVLCCAVLLLQEAESVRRAMGVKPMGQVFYMPAASDAYVAGFRWVGGLQAGRQERGAACWKACLLGLSSTRCTCMPDNPPTHSESHPAPAGTGWRVWLGAGPGGP